MTCYRKALELQPDCPDAYNGLGTLEWGAGQLDMAVSCFRKAVELSRGEVKSSYNASLILAQKGRWHEAASTLDQALRENPVSETTLGPLLHLYNGRIGNVLAFYGRMAKDQPDAGLPRAIAGLGLLFEGRFLEALSEFRAARQLITAQNRRFQEDIVAGYIRDVEGLQALNGQLSAYFVGERRPQDADERRRLILLCVIRKRFQAAARVNAAALATDPKWAGDCLAEAHYEAARFAALAAAGQGADAPKPDDPERGRWRRQALVWLRAELGLWARQLEAPDRLDRAVAVGRLRWWQADPDLAVIRDEGALDKLPAEERDACRKLWADVRQLLGHAVP